MVICGDYICQRTATSELISYINIRKLLTVMKEGRMHEYEDY